ncbi:MAG: ferritin family protein [Nitrospirae bacterium]|nr:ferritin family protein [Nitrospirota bacterium]
MSGIFKGSEIVEIGIQIEKNGWEFYQSLADSSQNEKVRESCRYLAGEEKKHIEDFEKLLPSLEKYVPPESYPGEYEAYVKALSEEHVFTNNNAVKDMIQKAPSDKEAIQIAIGFEKDSLLFFGEIGKFVPNYDRQVIEELIRQEREHLSKLSELKKTI